MNLYPSLVGSVGLSNFSPKSKVIEFNTLPPFVSNLTLQVFTSFSELT